MKQSIFLAALGLTTLGAAAQEVGTVLSSVPMVQQVAVPRQVCNQQPMVVEQQPSGAGGLLGAIAGAAIGSQVGGGSGRGVAMVAGTIGGALLGNQMERGNQYVQNVPQCGTQTSYENRTVGYNVTYEYAGRQYNVQMPYDPGPTIQLQITPVGASDPNQPYPSAGVAQGYPQGPVVVAPPVQPVVVAPYPPVVYGGYGYPAYRPYPPVGVSLNFGFGHGHRHRHWR